MAAYSLTPRLHRPQGRWRFWAACCLVAFLISFGLGSVWAERRAAGPAPSGTFARAG